MIIYVACSTYCFVDMSWLFYFICDLHLHTGSSTINLMFTGDHRARSAAQLRTVCYPDGISQYFHERSVKTKNVKSQQTQVIPVAPHQNITPAHQFRSSVVLDVQPQAVFFFFSLCPVVLY